MTPPALNRVVKTCLAKDPEDRFQTAHDVKLQLEWIAEGGSQAGLPAPVVARRKNREKLAWAVAAVRALRRRRSRFGFLRRAPKPAARRRGSRSRPPEDVIVDRRAAHLAGRADPRVQRDGRRREDADLGPAARTRSRRSRSRARRERRVPFWSPDSRFLGFFADGKLKKIDVSRRPAAEDLRRADGLRRHLEPRGRDPLRRHGHRSDPPRLRRRAARPPSP